MTVGQRIKQRRKELGMSADKLASRIGKDRSTVFRYEKGDIENLPLDILEPIAKALLITPQALMGWEEKESFVVPQEVYAHYATLKEAGAKKEEEWNALIGTQNYTAEYYLDGELKMIEK